MKRRAKKGETPKMVTYHDAHHLRDAHKDTPIQIENETIRDILARSRQYLLRTRKYPDELKVLALTLRTSGYTYEKMTEITGVSEPTLVDWVKNPSFDTIELKNIADGIKERLSSRLLINANQSFNAAMTDEKIAKASYLQLVVGGSTMIDKARLLNNESTENIAMISKKVMEYDSKRADLNDEILDSQAEIMALEKKLDTGEPVDNLVDN